MEPNLIEHRTQFAPSARKPEFPALAFAGVCRAIGEENTPDPRGLGRRVVLDGTRPPGRVKRQNSDKPRKVGSPASWRP
jgi:hypothetical protein